MKADLLTVVTVYFNPILYESRRKLYRAFREHMRESGVRLITVECALGDREFEVTDPCDPNDLQVRCHSLIWNKENLINLGIQHAGPHAKYIAWVDGDVRFRRPDWAAATVHALQHYKIVQPWQTVYDLGPNDEHLSTFTSFCHELYHRKPYCGNASGDNGYTYWHPGFAWAVRRDVLERLGGLMELCALGAGDHHMAMALIGKAHDSVHGGMRPSRYLDYVMAWQERAQKHVDGQIGYVRGTIEHGFHGKKVNRKYWDRWQILIDAKFDPFVDTKYNLAGVVELNGNKANLRHDLDLYFRQRAEDANSLQ